MATMDPMLGMPRTACDPAAEEEAAAAPDETELEAREVVPDADPLPELEAEPDREVDEEADAVETPEGRDMDVEATPPTATVLPPERVEGAEATSQLAVFTPLEMVEYVRQLEVAGIQAGAEGVTVCPTVK